MSEHQTINISTITLLKVVFIGLLFWFLWQVRDVLLIFLISIIVSSAMDPVADTLAKWRIPRSLSVLFVYAIFLGLIGLIGALIVPSLTEQYNQIRNTDVLQNFASRIGVVRESLLHSAIG